MRCRYGQLLKSSSKSTGFPSAAASHCSACSNTSLNMVAGTEAELFQGDFAGHHVCAPRILFSPNPRYAEGSVSRIRTATTSPERAVRVPTAMIAGANPNRSATTPARMAPTA
jgi:hypothetical protein